MFLVTYTFNFQLLNYTRLTVSQTITSPYEWYYIGQRLKYKFTRGIILVISPVFMMVIASLMFIASCMRMFFIFNIYTHISAGNIIGKPDWKLALQKIDELQKIVRAQDDRILMLEQRPPEFQVQTVIELQNTVKKQGDQIAQLEARVQKLEDVLKAEDDDPVNILGNGPLPGTNRTSVISNKTYSRRGTFHLFILYMKPIVIKNLSYFHEREKVFDILPKANLSIQ